MQKLAKWKSRIRITLYCLLFITTAWFIYIDYQAYQLGKQMTAANYRVVQGTLSDYTNAYGQSQGCLHYTSIITHQETWVCGSYIIFGKL